MEPHKGIPFKEYPILMVDDDKSALIGFSERYGDDFTILTASSGKDALDIIESKSDPKIAVIITDQRMPGMTGVELLFRARLLAGDMVRMLITAYTEMDIVIKAINEGNVYRYLTKPYNQEDLHFAMMQGIERYWLEKERDRLYAEKIEALKRVSKTNRLTAIGILASGMAHEINNPLVSIYTFLQMFPEKMKEPEMDKEYSEGFYNVAIKETRRIQSLVAQLLNYSKNSEQGELFLRQVDLNSVIKDVVMLLKNEANKKEIKFELLLNFDLPKGNMDEEKMRQVILNLCLNAIHATESGKITLTTAIHNVEKPYFEIVIDDSGAGISEENLQQLFNPFFTTKGPEGTGLGLMACHHIIDQHRGNIDVQSQLRKGTKVIIQLPTDPITHERRKVDRRI